MTTALREEPTLPAAFPLPKPVDSRTAVIDRDGTSCRLCGKTVQSDPIPLVNCRPGKAAGEWPELQMALACFGCASDVSAARRAAGGEAADAPRRERIVLRLLTLLYLENCQMAEVQPLRVVNP